MDNVPNGMFVNGPKAGQIIKLPEPLPEMVTVATMINLCHHRPEDANPMLMIQYSVNKIMSGNLYMLTTDDKTIGNAYYCMECKAEKEVKYRLQEVRDLLDDALADDE